MDKIASILQWVCLAVSLFSVIYQRNPRFLHAFPVYFLIAIGVQFYGNFLAEHGKANVWLYNSFNTLEFSFNFFILRSLIRTASTRRVLLWLSFGFPVISFINIYQYQDTSVFHTVSYGIGCLLIAVFCILYFVELFQMPKAIDLMKSPAFWICTATLFSYTCTFPFWGMANMLSVSRSNFEKALTIVTVINILSYVLFVIAFLCRIRIRKFIS